MVFIKVIITKFISDDQPGWVECLLVDAYGTEWTFVEKIPVVTTNEINKSSNFPQDGFIAGKITKRWKDKNDSPLFTVKTLKPWGIESTDGQSIFDVLYDTII